MNINEATKLLNNHNIDIKEIKSIIGSFDKNIFHVDNAYVLRPSLLDMQNEQNNFNRKGKSELDRIPKLIQWLEGSVEKLHQIL